MLARILNRITDSFLARVPVPVYLAPVACLPNTSAGLSIREIFDGLTLATPKRRTPLRQIWKRKYGDTNWKYGTKLLQPKRNIVTCPECGDFHEFHAICRTCFKKVQEESKMIINSIKDAWKRNIIDKEVQVLYQGETAKSIENKRIVELERPRPSWFTSNLSQKSANISSLPDTPTEKDDRVVRVKVDDK